MSSVIDIPKHSVQMLAGPLRNGDTLDQPTFHELYEQTPKDFRAELIEGVVYVSSPVSAEHSESHIEMAGWLAVYKAATPGVVACDNGSVILDFSNEYQPDASLAIVEEGGGQSRVNKKGYVEGAPELCVEVAYSSAAIDLHAKKKVYARTGVREYVVAVLQAGRVDCFELNNKVFKESPADEAGIWKSGVFPGLWLNGPALIRKETAAVLETLHEGLATPEHQQFCEKLKSLRT